MKPFINLTQILQIIFSIFLLLSCSNSNKEKDKKHEKLISWSNKFISEDGEKMDGYYNNHKEFIKPYSSDKQIGDTLVVSTLHEINACGETVGDISYSGDTLFLKTKQIGNEVCASIVFSKFTYKILNRNKTKYKIVSEN